MCNTVSPIANVLCIIKEKKIPKQKTPNIYWVTRPVVPVRFSIEFLLQGDTIVQPKKLRQNQSIKRIEETHCWRSVSQLRRRVLQSREQ